MDKNDYLVIGVAPDRQYRLMGSDSCPICGGNLQHVPVWRSLEDWEKPLLLTVEEFAADVVSGCFTDRDGHGHWATDKAVIQNSRVLDYFSDLCPVPPTITHVVWYNK
jgi:hypothetical protein